MNKPRKYLLFDRGIIDGHLCQNAVLRLAKAEKDTKNNPMMTEEFCQSFQALGSALR